MFDIKEEVKNLPSNPGVYLMHDKSGKIIYVGKAKNLKNRVSQYFRESSSHTPKVRAMVSHVARFEYIITDSELEALVLECNLIKKHRPKYNILLKDDKHYPFIKVSMQEDYPRISIARKVNNDGARYFGPYMGVNTINNTLEIIRKIFNPPTCTKKFPQDIGKTRPCLNYHIKNCFAPCTGKVSKEEYRAVFEDICKFLDGNHLNLQKELEEEMKQASASLEFEKAALLRDKIKAMQKIDEKQKIFNADKSEDKDVVAVAAEGDIAFVQVFFIRGGKVIGRETYEIKDTESLSKSEILGNFIKQFYLDIDAIPAQIVLQHDISDRELLEEMLRGRRKGRFSLTVPRRGENVKLVELVEKNALEELENYKIRKIRENKNKILQILKNILSLDKEPRRIESYDISNISGAQSVGVMVVFADGKKAPSLYRNFRIKTVEGADDYASTQEVIYRRIRRAVEEEEKIRLGQMQEEDAKFLPLPDVIFADGGKGHVSAIKQTLESMEVDIPVFGMVKDSRHRTKGLVSEMGEISLSPTSVAFNFLTSVQDEVHRVAVTYFRKLHTQKSFHSELDDIQGVGKARRNALLSAFGNISKIKSASFEELIKVVDKRTANNIISYFRNGE